jgi:hypothetical protein
LRAHLTLVHGGAVRRLLASTAIALAAALLVAGTAAARDTARFRVVSGSVVQTSTWKSVSSNKVCSDRTIVWTDSGTTSVRLHLVGHPTLTVHRGAGFAKGRLTFRGVQSRHSHYGISYDGAGSQCFGGPVTEPPPRTSRCGTRTIKASHAYLYVGNHAWLSESFNAFGSGCVSDSEFATSLYDSFWPPIQADDVLVDEPDKEFDLYGDESGQFPDRTVFGPGSDQGPHSQDGASRWKLKLRRLRG